jgi:hypothetical protein
VLSIVLIVLTDADELRRDSRPRRLERAVLSSTTAPTVGAGAVGAAGLGDARACFDAWRAATTSSTLAVVGVANGATLHDLRAGSPLMLFIGLRKGPGVVVDIDSSPAAEYLLALSLGRGG